MTPPSYLSPADWPPDSGDGTSPPPGMFPAEGDDLPYRVEVWDDTGDFVEQVVAVSLSPAIGYAAYYAASKEYPNRVITLKHRAQVIARFTARSN